MVDVFEEVEGQLRSDQYSGFVRKHLPWVVGVCVLALAIALGFLGYDRYREQAAEKASQDYAQGLESMAHGDTAAAAAKFAAVAKSSSPIYRTLAQMQQAGLRLNANDVTQAVQLFDAAAKGAPNESLADIARLKSALALLDTASYADLEARLTPLADAKQPFHALAREALAMAKLRDGKFAAARADFLVLTTTLDAPDDLRERARAAITLIDDGSAAGIPPTVKAALALPTPAPAPAGAAQAQQTPVAGAAQ